MNKTNLTEISGYENLHKYAINIASHKHQASTKTATVPNQNKLISASKSFFSILIMKPKEKCKHLKKQKESIL